MLRGSSEYVATVQGYAHPINSVRVQPARNSIHNSADLDDSSSRPSTSTRSEVSEWIRTEGGLEMIIISFHSILVPASLNKAHSYQSFVILHHLS